MPFLEISHLVQNHGASIVHPLLVVPTSSFFGVNISNALHQRRVQSTALLSGNSPGHSSDLADLNPIQKGAQKAFRVL